MWQTPYWVALSLWGGLVFLGSLAVLAVVIFVPGDSGYVMPKIFVLIFAGRGMVYGVSQIRAAMKERHSLAKEARND